MGKFISDKTFLNDNILRHGDRLESQYNIFQGGPPTFVTYYNIDDVNSIVDVGFKDAHGLIGPNSPTKYKKLKDFPIYGIDQMDMNIDDNDEGINIEYEGDGVILPHTIRPTPNDFFTIDYLGKTYLFRVSALQYDTIKSNNYYKFQFYLHATDGDTVPELEKQVLENYSTLFDNIGTQDKCIILDTELETYDSIIKTYDTVVDRYIRTFYSKRHNSFICDPVKKCGIGCTYDRYLARFIQHNNILNRRKQYETIILSNEDSYEDFDYDYMNSIYELIQNRNIEDLDYVRFDLAAIMDPNSVFLIVGFPDTTSVKFTDYSDREYLSDTLIDNVKSNTHETDESLFDKLLISHFNNNLNIIPEDLMCLKTMKFDKDLKTMIEIPIIMFILKEYAIRLIRRKEMV